MKGQTYNEGSFVGGGYHKLRDRADGILYIRRHFQVKAFIPRHRNTKILLLL